MKVKDYESLPDGMSKFGVEKILDVFFNELERDSRDTAIEKLDILSEYQWHTHELPSASTQEKVTKFLIDSWDNESDYAEFVMGIVYCFGLSKELFEKALEVYSDPNDSEFLEMLSNSKGASIDPYWSMRK